MLAPAGTAPDVITVLHGAIGKALAEPAVRERIVADGSELVASSPEQFRNFIKRDIPKWTKVIRDSGARSE